MPLSRTQGSAPAGWSYIRFADNAAIIDEKMEPKGTRILAPVANCDANCEDSIPGPGSVVGERNVRQIEIQER